MGPRSNDGIEARIDDLEKSEQELTGNAYAQADAENFGIEAADLEGEWAIL